MNKASRNLGFIFRTIKHFKNLQCLKSLYCSLVRSVLEYASVVWSSFYRNGIDRIEAVQRRFICFALRRLPWQLPSYESCCSLLGIDTLSVRRDVGKAVFVDILATRTDCSNLLGLIRLHAHSRSSRNSTLLFLPPRRTNYASDSSINGLLRHFNRLSSVFDIMYLAKR